MSFSSPSREKENQPPATPQIKKQVMESSPLVFPTSQEPSSSLGLPKTPAGRFMAKQLNSDMSFPSTPKGGVAGDSPLAYPPSDPLTPKAHLPSQLSSSFSHPSRPGSTPRPRRGDVRADTSRLQRLSQLASTPLMQSQGLPSSLSDAMEGVQLNRETDETMIIWGTTVNVEECKNLFKEFLVQFTMQDKLTKWREEGLEAQGQMIAITERDKEPFYPTVMNDASWNMFEQESFLLNLDCDNIKAYAPCAKLHKLLIRYPQEIIPLMDYVATELFLDLHSDVPEGFSGITVRPYNLGRQVNLRSLDPSDIDQMVTVKGLLIRASPVIPDMKTAFFRCNVCHATVNSENDRGRIKEPTTCPNESCRSLNSISIIHNRCTFSNKQICKLQETPDETPAGQTPHTVSIFCYDELVDIGKPGDRLEITAIYRGQPVRANPRRRTLKSLYRTYLDVVHIKRADPKRVQLDTSIASAIENASGSNYKETDMANQLTPEDEQKFLNLSNRPDLYDLLARSVAPSIFGMDDVKKGVLMQLFGGTNKVSKSQLGSPRIRGDINVLLMGDPGVSKSQLLQYVNKVAPRGIYTSGKGSSAVGLTAYITRDPDTRQLVLESGALVLSDGGICCIDEFDKMSDHTRSVLHEVMEQQTISVAKAGIITTLNARASILASANPIDSKFDPKRSIVENINLPPPLLSRFDLIFLLLDKPNEQKDRKLASHIVSLYMTQAGSLSDETEILKSAFFAKYINYARNTVFPRLSSKASEVLVEMYVNMRRRGKLSGSGKTVTGTTRQLESMIRLSEAHAKMRLSPIVEESDVQEAHRLIEEAMQSSAIDPMTGLVDLDLIQTGTSSRVRGVEEERRERLRLVLNSLDKNVVGFAECFGAYRKMYEEIIPEREFERLLDELADTDFIHISGKTLNEKKIRKRAVE